MRLIFLVCCLYSITHAMEIVEEEPKSNKQPTIYETAAGYEEVPQPKQQHPPTSPEIEVKQQEWEQVTEQRKVLRQNLQQFSHKQDQLQQQLDTAKQQLEKTIKTASPQQQKAVAYSKQAHDFQQAAQQENAQTTQDIIDGVAQTLPKTGFLITMKVWFSTLSTKALNFLQNLFTETNTNIQKQQSALNSALSDQSKTQNNLTTKLQEANTQERQAQQQLDTMLNNLNTTQVLKGILVSKGQSVTPAEYANNLINDSVIASQRISSDEYHATIATAYKTLIAQLDTALAQYKNKPELNQAFSVEELPDKVQAIIETCKRLNLTIVNTDLASQQLQALQSLEVIGNIYDSLEGIKDAQKQLNNELDALGKKKSTLQDRILELKNKEQQNIPLIKYVQNIIDIQSDITNIGFFLLVDLHNISLDQLAKVDFDPQNERIDELNKILISEFPSAESIQTSMGNDQIKIKDLVLKLSTTISDYIKTLNSTVQDAFLDTPDYSHLQDDLDLLTTNPDDFFTQQQAKLYDACRWALITVNPDYNFYDLTNLRKQSVGDMHIDLSKYELPDIIIPEPDSSVTDVQGYIQEKILAYFLNNVYSFFKLDPKKWATYNDATIAKQVANVSQSSFANYLLKLINSPNQRKVTHAYMQGAKEVKEVARVVTQEQYDALHSGVKKLDNYLQNEVGEKVLRLLQRVQQYYINQFRL